MELSDGMGQWDDTAAGHGSGGDHGTADGGYGYPPDDGYAGYGRPDYAQQDYAQQDYGPQGYGQYGDGYGPGPGSGYDNSGYDNSYDNSGYDSGYAGPGGYGYPPADGGPGGFGQPGYGEQPSPGYGITGGFVPGAPSGGYPVQGGSSGGYPALPGGTGGYPAEDAGNDWYGGQPAAASGASFADTGTYTLNGRIIDEYGTGPRQALRDPVHGYPPAPGLPPTGAQLPAPALPAGSGPQAVPRTGQQDRYDDYGPYPGYGPDDPAAAGPGTGGYPTATDLNAYDIYDRRDARSRSGGFGQPDDYGQPGGYADGDGYAEPGGPGARGYDDYAGYGEEDAAFAAAPIGDVRDAYAGYAPDEDPYSEPYPEETGRRRKRKARRRRGAEPDADAVAGAGAALGAPGAPGAPAGPAEVDTAGQPQADRRRGKRPLRVVLTAGAVGVIGAAAYFVISMFVSQAPANNPNAAGPIPTAGSVPSQQACTKQYGTYCHIEMRTDDPTPLTLSELYPPAFTNEKDKSAFTLISTKLDKKCSNAVIGQSLISELAKGKCTQALRASYLSGDEKIMGTIGVVNLATTNEAHYAGRVIGHDDFIAPLSSSKGVGSKLGQGTGVVGAEFKGHYLILTWAEFSDGTTPSTNAEDKQLEQFSNDLVAGTANISLSQRMVTGAPPTPGAG